MSGYLDLWRTQGLVPEGGRSATLPAPLDARNGNDLAGAQGSHPLAFIDLETLLHPATDGLSGEIVVEPGVQVGGEIKAQLRLRALRSIDGRAASLALRGYLLREQARSATRGSGDHQTTERWVEVVAEELETIPLTEMTLPVKMNEGEEFRCTILAPAPRLGPPSAHAGPAAVVWLLVASWDIAMGGDQRIAAIVPVAQHRDLVTAGMIEFTDEALLDFSSENGASFTLHPAPPISAGATLTVQVLWPKASGGRSARVELHADISGLGNICVASVKTTAAELATGMTAELPIPADAPPVLDALGVRVRYRLRALVDRAFLPDLALERGVAIVSPE